MGADFDFFLGEIVTDHGFGIRISDLEGKNVRAEFYAEITAVEGVSGTITLPTGATLFTNSWQNSYEGIVTTISAGELPDEGYARESDGSIITVSLLDNGDGTADYTLSGTPFSYPVAIVYEYYVAWIDYVLTNDLNNLITVSLEPAGYQISVGVTAPSTPTENSFWLDTSGTTAGTPLYPAIGLFPSNSLFPN